jgi:dihydroorotate dehydrogenase (NAD+) catalytic subunit
VFHDPNAPIRILAELEAELDRCGFASVADAVGYAHRSPAERDRPAGTIDIEEISA